MDHSCESEASPGESEDPFQLCRGSHRHINAAKEVLKDVEVISALRRETLQESCGTTRRGGNDLEHSSQNQNNH
ncbi:hypothetical protein EK904_005489 [Melospiza melodia maxima]|nr:hypothetical protein EK904_005489 [Melospiza melodia maxima]